MKKITEIEFIRLLVRKNQHLTTKEEKSWYRSALCAALNWGHRIDREQEAYRKAQKRKNITQRV